MTIVIDNGDDGDEAVADAIHEQVEEEREHHKVEEQQEEVDHEIEHERRHAEHERRIEEIERREWDQPAAPEIDIDTIVEQVADRVAERIGDEIVDEIIEAVELADLIEDEAGAEEVVEVSNDPAPDVTAKEINAARPKPWWSKVL